MNLKQLALRFLRVFRRRRFDAEMREEMQFHLELRIAANVKAGMPLNEAERDAWRRFGHLDSYQEQSREIRAGAWLESFLRDLAYAFRQIGKSPAFTATVVVTLGLAMAAGTVVFTAIDTAVLHPVNSPDIDRFVIIQETQLPSVPQSQLSVPSFLDLERENQSFEYLGAWTGVPFLLTGGAEPLALRGAMVTQHVFRIMDNHLNLGRSFMPEDFKLGQDHVVILSPSFWRRAFGSAPDVVGKVVHLNNEAFTVIGVLGDEFSRLGSDIEVWTPMIFTESEKIESERNFRRLQTQALLKRGVDLSRAQAELDLIARRLAADHPKTNEGRGLLVRDFRSYLNRYIKPLLILVVCAVGCVMAIACVNVAGLLLARGAARQREIVIRSALGAGRTRIVRQMLVESSLLSLIASGVGIVLAFWGLRFLRAYGPSAGTDLARLASAELNGPIFVTTLCCGVVTGIVFGLAPAWLNSGVNLNDALKQGARNATEKRGRLRRALVSIEVALAVVLLSGAGLMIQNAIRVTQLDPGFSPDRIVSMPLQLRMPTYQKNEARWNFAAALLDHVRALPGVESAALTSVTPFNTPNLFTFTIVGHEDADSKNRPAAIAYIVTPGYFETMGVRVLRGQVFSGQIEPTGPPPVVVNETFARVYLGGTDVLGQRLRVGPGPNGILEIGAVVGDVMQGRPDVTGMPQIYVPWTVGNPGNYFLVVRSRQDPSTILSSLKPQVYAVDRDQAAGLPRTMTEMMNDATAKQRLTLRVLVIFAGIALLIAAVGVYGVVSYSVGQRTTEIGVRMALGASPSDISRHFLIGGITMIGAGIAIGLTLTLFLSRLIQSVLYNAEARDPLTLGAIVGVMVVVALFACYLPARRAANVDPLVALRTE